jgi:hypothetical protein
MSNLAEYYEKDKTGVLDCARGKYRIINCVDKYEVNDHEIENIYVPKFRRMGRLPVNTPVDFLSIKFPTLWQAHNAWEDVIFNVKNDINSAIEEAKVLLTFQEDWDENGALPTDIETFDLASTFLQRFNLILAGGFFTLEKPFIDITNKGGISLKWENDRAEFYIIFNKLNKDFAYYYGESKNDDKPDKIKSGIDLHLTHVDEFLLFWFKKYFCKNGIRP